MIEPEIIYEDKNFLAINKPAGLLVHRDKPTSTEPTVADWLVKKYPEIRSVGDHSTSSWQAPSMGSTSSPRASSGQANLRPGIVHRLDKETSGVMLVAKNQKYFEYLKRLFQSRQIKKTYLALVFGKLEPRRGVITKAIGIKSGTIKRSVHSAKMAKEAVTEYRVIKYIGGPEEPQGALGKREGTDGGFFSLVEVSPKTGRTHQIRVHLASIHHPVLGDKLYGPKQLRTNDQRLTTNDLRQTTRASHKSAERLMLHALSLEFATGGGGRIKVEASPPHQFMKFIEEDLV
jgi:23S rRNA pseudouridine1911/1915/1917 synthase